MNISIQRITKVAVFREDGYAKISVIDDKGAIHELCLFGQSLEFLPTDNRRLVVYSDFPPTTSPAAV